MKKIVNYWELTLRAVQNDDRLLWRIVTASTLLTSVTPFLHSSYLGWGSIVSDEFFNRPAPPIFFSLSVFQSHTQV